MTPHARPRVSYGEFTQRVRRHKPSELLPALALSAIEFSEREVWLKERIRLPWAIAGAAKASIVSGNEFRHIPVTERDVMEICHAYNNLDGPLRPQSGEILESFVAFMVRLNHEQFIFQRSEYQEICRMATLFDNIETLELEFLSQEVIGSLLGCSVGDFVGAGFVIAQGAKVSSGFFDPEWPHLWNGEGAIDHEFSMDIVRQVFHRHFVTNFEDFKNLSAALSQPRDDLRQHEFNPLVGKPFIELPDGRFVAPQFQFAFQRLSPSTVYYAGVEALAKIDCDAFTRDMGVVFQDYVGRQLRLIPGAEVHAEITYDNDQRSVDWFVVFPDVVILVEAKSTRLSHLARMGGQKLKGDLDRCIGVAYAQVTRSNNLVKDHPAFKSIPNDRRRIALVVTMEPYWNANAANLEGFLAKPEIPTMVVSIATLEHLVGVFTQLGGPEVLVGIVDDVDRRTWELESALPKIAVPNNPILDEAWRRFPFGDWGERIVDEG